jgi:ketosteroid isomerase-like protein
VIDAPTLSADTARAMSRENVEVVQRAYEAMWRDDVDEFLDYVDSDVEWDSLVMEVEGTFRGHEGVREWFRSLRAAFPDWNPTVGEVREFGAHVVVHARGEGSGASSGVDIASDLWQAAEIRDGRIVWYASFRTEGEALEAVGLRE